MRLAASIRDMETVAGAALDKYHAVDRPDMPPPRMAICVRGDIGVFLKVLYRNAKGWRGTEGV